jgi:PPM family protein phosphatase
MQLMPYRLETFGISDIGLVRQNNEDIWAELPEYRFFVLADGMGGHLAGEIAAKEAVTSLSHFVEDFLSQSSEPFTNQQLISQIREGITLANRWVYHLSRANEEFYGMGTTLCCFLLYRDTLIYAHVGDSRIYRFRGQLEQLTQDHSLRRELIGRLGLDEKKASTLPFKNIITRAIGTSQNVEPEVSSLIIQPGDIYFLCSDGLTDSVSHEEMEDILKKSSSVKESCQDLVSTAKAKGGIDNITIVMIKLHE